MKLRYMHEKYMFLLHWYIYFFVKVVLHVSHVFSHLFRAVSFLWKAAQTCKEIQVTSQIISHFWVFDDHTIKWNIISACKCTPNYNKVCGTKTKVECRIKCNRASFSAFHGERRKVLIYSVSHLVIIKKTFSLIF